jgi:hypothetical protein
MVPVYRIENMAFMNGLFPFSMPLPHLTLLRIFGADEN